MILTISGIILLIGFIFIVIGSINDNFLFPLGIISVIMSLFLGFIMIGTFVDVETKIEIFTPTDLTKSETTIFAKVNGTVFSTTEHKFFSTDLKNLKIKRTVYINSYGCEIENNMSPKYEWFIIEGNLEKAE